MVNEGTNDHESRKAECIYRYSFPGWFHSPLVGLWGVGDVDGMRYLPEDLCQPGFKDLHGLGLAVEEDGVHLFGWVSNFAARYRYIVHTDNLPSLAPHAHGRVRMVADAGAHGRPEQGHGASVPQVAGWRG